MANPNPRDRLRIIRRRLAIIVLAIAIIAIIAINLWPGKETIMISSHGVFSEYTWHWFGWPAAYFTQETAWTSLELRDYAPHNETQFSLFALVVNTCVAFSVCGLAWCAGSLISKRQFGLRTLFFVTLCVAVLSAALSRATSSSLDKSPPWQRQSEG